MYDLANKSIIITGAGRGMGRETALLAGRAGAQVTVADMDEASGRETVAMISGAGGTAHFVRVDVANEAQVEAMVAAAVSTYGRLDGAFNNAGVPPSATVLHELRLETFQRAMSINLVGVFLCMKHEIAAMLKTGSGSIVNTASTAGLAAFPAATEYIASKHGVIGLTKAGAVDYGKLGIRINAVLPGATLTPMLVGAMASTPGLEEYMIAQQPIGRLGQPREIANAAVWLLSDDASFVTGASLSVDGGYTAV